MHDVTLSAIFDECLDRLAAGETVEQCLRRYPQQTEALRPLLQSVRLTQAALPDATEIYAAQQRARRRVTAALAEQLPARKPPVLGGLRSLAAVAVLALVFAGVALATSSSLPGDPLYGFKRQAEVVGLALAGDSQAARERLSQTRRDEVRRLLEAGRESEVTFSGKLQAVAGDVWQVERLPVRIDPDSQIDPAIRAGDLVEVSARTTADRRLVAGAIQLREAAAPERTPAPTAPPATPTAMQPTMTDTAVPTRTPTPAATERPSAMPTLSPAPTDSPVQPAVEGCAPVHPPDWVVYQVRAGDTLSGFAQATGATIENMIATNCLRADGLIVVGQSIYLPSVPPTRAPAVQSQPPAGSGDPDPSGDDSSGNRGPGGSNGDDGNDDSSGS